MKETQSLSLGMLVIAAETGLSAGVLWGLGWASHVGVRVRWGRPHLHPETKSVGASAWLTPLRDLGPFKLRTVSAAGLPKRPPRKGRSSAGPQQSLGDRGVNQGGEEASANSSERNKGGDVRRQLAKG